MSTLGAMLLVLAVVGMLLTYYIGYAVGRREGFNQGRHDGKREGSVRAYAVGYDRGRHDRKAKSSEEDSDEGSGNFTGWGCLLWLLPLVIALLAIIAIAASRSMENGH